MDGIEGQIAYEGIQLLQPLGIICDGGFSILVQVLCGRLPKRAPGALPRTLQPAASPLIFGRGTFPLLRGRSFQRSRKVGDLGPTCRCATSRPV